MPKVVLANGCFDPLHYGHLLHLRAAKTLGDELVVSITNDEMVRVEKGNGRPVLDEKQRADFVASLKFVDRVVVVQGVMHALQSVKPDVLVKGIDYADSVSEYVKGYCAENGIEIAITITPKWSATELISELRSR